MGPNTESVRLILNISEKHKFFFWTPPKTASEHANLIFSLFDFEGFICDFRRENIFEHKNFPIHNHNQHLFYGHENYKLITTARNPLNILFSAYLYSNRKEQNYSIEGFREFFSQEKKKNFTFWFMGCNNILRIPDYYIRQEFLFDDYSKLPFIHDSKIKKFGILEELSSKKLNQSDNIGLRINDCYTQEMIDFLYNKFKLYFDKLEYKPEI